MASATTAGFRLGIDFGTSHTTAVLRWPDGRVRPLLFDGSPLLPSAVYAEADGTLLVGRDAVHAARLDPARFEPSPKRRIDRDSVTLGDAEVPVTTMIAAVLSRVKDEAVRVSGTRVDDLTLTHPAGWSGARLAKLTDASRLAGLPDPAMVAEPVAAAGYFVSVLGRAIPSGSALIVYDFGGGTFDASAVTPAHDGYRVLAMAGLDNLGGVDLDAALLEFVTTVHRGQDPQAWHRLEQPETAADRRHRRHLIEDIRAAKEMLSRAPSAAVPVPLLELEARVSREEFDALARPLLERTVATTLEVIHSANLPPERIAAVLLVGGSSRIPLVPELLREASGVTPSTIDQPETVVAEGSVRLASGASGTTRAASAVAAPLPAAVPAATPVDTWAGEQPTPVLPVPAAAGAPSFAPGAAAIPSPPAAPPLTLPVPVVVESHHPQWTDLRTPPRSHPGVVVRPRRRGRWLALVAVVLVLALLAAGAAIWRLRPDLLSYIGLGTQPTQTPTQQQTYVRPVTPLWLPSGWTKIVDDEQRASVIAGEATNGGTCTYLSAGTVRVQRQQFDVSGCVAQQFVKDTVVSDGAVEAELSVAKGCGGMWIRTGNKGYFIAVCANGTVELHKLAIDAPGTDSRLSQIRPSMNPQRVVLGLLARGSTLTVFVDGREQGAVTDGTIASGRVAIGGFAPHPDDALDATIVRFRAWSASGSGT
jgi:Hsp70 protein